MQGDLKELNLGENIYIGGYPGVYHPESGAYTGLHGAVQRVCYMLPHYISLIMSRDEGNNISHCKDYHSKYIF